MANAPTTWRVDGDWATELASRRTAQGTAHMVTRLASGKHHVLEVGRPEDVLALVTLTSLRRDWSTSSLRNCSPNVWRGAFLDFVRPDEDRIVWIEGVAAQVISCFARR